jgi:cytochrome c peroxidase
MSKQATLLLVLFFLLFSFSLKKFHGFNPPKYFPIAVYDFDKNHLKKETVELGRLLFYDPVLSADSSISCASCHSPYNAFAHTDHALSHGINDEIGTRNAPALFNLAWYNKFMWDGAINHLDVQALAPITHVKEMNETLENIVSKLQKSPFYRTKFDANFKDGEISGERILKALSQFQLTLVSANSKYDRVKMGKEKFSEQESNGYVLFQNKCATCHQEPLFSSHEFANNQLKIDENLRDNGLGKRTQKKADDFQFKIPSLRNLSYTYPYMHDGRFTKLNEVLKHYASNDESNPALDVRLKKAIGTSLREQVDIISFLLTINDVEFVFNPKHQFPKELLTKAKDK